MMRNAFILLTVCMIFTRPLYGGERWKAFLRLSCPEKWWVVFHPFIASKAHKITEEARAVAGEIESDPELDGDAAGGQVDAFRHGYWMWRLSSEIKPRKAISLGKAHEKGNYRKFKKGKTEDGVLPDSVSSVMDTLNNRIAVSMARQSPAKAENVVREKVKKAVLEGKFFIVLKNRKGIPVDSMENPLIIPEKAVPWGIPKVLVKSNTIRPE